MRTAGELFWRQGYAGTGVSEIMRRAGATSGSFYHFFPTKDDLLLAVIDAAREWVGSEMVGAAEAAADESAARLARLVEAYRERTAPGAGGFGLPVGALVGELGPEHDEARRRLAAVYELLVDRVASWLVDAGDTQERRSLAEHVVAALEGAALMARAEGRAGPVDACGAMLLRLVTSGTRSVIRSTDEMPPPESSGDAVGDWKAW